ncbi:hypothetical protein AB0J63_48595 [Streptosporangium canum]|uniref:hypothetical protein n=1 Tax=Streptosporangium canum TaxID=324952 RepID=UPI00343D455C
MKDLGGIRLLLSMVCAKSTGLTDRLPPFRGLGAGRFFQASVEGLIAEAAARGQVELDLVNVASVIVRAHHDAAGKAVDQQLLTALEGAITEEKGLRRRDKTSR